MAFGLSQEIQDLLKRYFAAIPEIELVKIYGSRAKGNFDRGSDIDMAFYSRSPKDLTGTIKSGLDALPTPYFFDATDYYRIDHAELKEHIDRVGIVFYEREEN